MARCPRQSCGGNLEQSGGDVGSLTSISPKGLLQTAKNFPMTRPFVELVTGDDGLLWSYKMKCTSCSQKYIQCGHCGAHTHVASFPGPYTDYLCRDCDEVTAIIGHG